MAKQQSKKAKKERNKAEEFINKVLNDAFNRVKENK